MQVPTVYLASILLSGIFADILSRSGAHCDLALAVQAGWCPQRSSRGGGGEDSSDQV